jgi:hypothetical protein
MPTTYRMLGAALFVLAAALTGCGPRDAAVAGSAPTGPPVLNVVDVDTVMAAIAKANLPAANAHDATASRCPDAGCVRATDTDTVTVMKFPSTGRAELYAAGVRDMLQVEDIVVVFGPTATNEQKAAYGQVVKNAVLTPSTP